MKLLLLAGFIVGIGFSGCSTTSSESRHVGDVASRAAICKRLDSKLIVISRQTALAATPNSAKGKLEGAAGQTASLVKATIIEVERLPRSDRGEHVDHVLGIFKRGVAGFSEIARELHEALGGGLGGIAAKVGRWYSGLNITIGDACRAWAAT